MEEITNQWAGLKLSESEGLEVNLAPLACDQRLVLARKFCTKRRVNLESVARVPKIAWKTEQNFEVFDMGDNKVLFHFGTKEDLERVLLLCLWSFDKYLLILHKLEVGEAVKKVKFNKASFWVLIHGHPTMSQMKDAGIRIGGTLGTVEKRPQLVVAKNGDGGGRTSQEHERPYGEDGGRTYTSTAVAKGARGSTKVTTRGDHVSADVANSVTLVEQSTCQIPENL
ncbi:hypothetical protein CFP56_018190 [Quercus suber]|uniref:DUF4283 domain-containing protein n=1 Tax=Quercus suber TaxID=58331 RepID=A0AAW0KIJ8_QUESU